MPVPYTPSAVKTLRFAADGGKNRAALSEMFGWDLGMFDRICARHDIIVAGIAQPVAARDRHLQDHPEITP